MRRRSFVLLPFFSLLFSIGAVAEDPKQTLENTISVKLAAPVKAQTFPRPVKFAIGGVVDRTGDHRGRGRGGGDNSFGCGSR